MIHSGIKDYLDRWGEKPQTVSLTCHCEQGTIKLRMALDMPNAGAELARLDFAALERVTSKVKIEILPADMGQEKLTITLPATEAVALFGGTQPCTATYDSIRRQVCERKRYPL